MEQLRTEAEKREIGWYFVIFSGNERPAYFDGKNWIVWGNMGFWNDSDLSKISNRLTPDFHAQQSKERDWISVTEKYPDEKQTVWCYSEKLDNVFLGEYVYVINEGWFWAESNGVIYASDGKIVSECEMDDFDVSHWFPTPLLPKKP